MMLTIPAAPRIASIDWTLTQPTQANRSEFTGARRVTILSQAPRWSAKVRFASAIGQRQIGPLRAFLAALQGQSGTFRLPVCEVPQGQVANPAVAVDGDGQQAFTLRTRGWYPNTGLRAGEFATIGDQLLQITADARAGVDGKATLAFAPYLRAVPADGAAIEVTDPYAVVSLTSDAAGWSVGPGQIYDVSIDCEESL